MSEDGVSGDEVEGSTGPVFMLLTLAGVVRTSSYPRVAMTGHHPEGVSP